MITQLELAANEAWPAPVQGRLGDWVLRAAEGWTGRGNSALAIGDPGRPLDEAIVAVRRWYAAQGLPARLNIPTPLGAKLNALLDERGWSTNPITLVQTAPVAGLVDATAPGEVQFGTSLSPAAAGLIEGRKKGLPAAARHILSAVPKARFAEVYDESGALLATARGTVTGNDRYLGIFLVEVVPGARRRGLAQRVIGALARWGQSEGAQTAFLQVEQRNTAAVALYQRLGFTTHHSYLTRTEGSS
jgi:ribosomal protein S18 acetylase RimI-like enzyme